MKQKLAGSLVVMLCVFSQGFSGIVSTAFAADQEFDQQIVMNVPPSRDLHVTTKEYVDGKVDGAEFPITEVVTPLYWKDPITGGSAKSRYLSSIVISPGSAAGTIQYSVDGGAPVVVTVTGLTPAGGVIGSNAEVERLKMEVAYLRGRVEALAGSVVYGDEAELAQNTFEGEDK